MSAIFVIFSELKNASGFLDTSILEAVRSRTEAEQRVRQLEDEGLRDGERVCRRADQWSETKAGRRVDEEGWSVNYNFVEVELND